MRSTSKQIGFSVAAQMFRYGAPLLFFPFLLRYLSTAEFAQFVFCMACGQTIGQFTEFGFGLSAARELVERDNDPLAAARSCGEVILGRLLLFLVSSGTYVLYIALTNGLSSSLPSTFLILLIGISYGFTPNWYYVGTERAHIMAAAEIVASVAQLILVVALVRLYPNHVIAAICMVIPIAFLAAGSHLQALRDLSFTLPSWSEMRHALKTSAHFFIATNGPTLASRAFIILLGIFASATQVMIFATADRMVTAARTTLAPVMRVLLAKVTRLHMSSAAAGNRLSRKVLLFGAATYTLGALALVLTLDFWLVPIFGRKMDGAELVFAIFLLSIPLAAVSRIVGLLFLVPLRKEAAYQALTLASCGIGVAAAYLFASRGALTLVVLRVSMELLITLGCLMLLVQQSKRADREAADGCVS